MNLYQQAQCKDQVQNLEFNIIFKIIASVIFGMEQSKQKSSIDSVNIDEFIWSQADDKSEAGKDRDSSFQMYTVSKTLKNATILQHLKPDYGSLGQFMKDVGMSKDLLLHNRKKKLDQQQDAEQKKLRSTLKDKNLQKVLKQEHVSPLEKSVASKMIIENLFQKNFGTTLSAFCSQNSKLQYGKNSFSSVQALGQILQQILKKPKYQSVRCMQINKHELPVLQKAKGQHPHKSVVIAGAKEKLKKIKQIKEQYYSLKKCVVDEERWYLRETSDGGEGVVGLEKKSSSSSQPKNKPRFVVENSIMNFNAVIELIRLVTPENLSVIKLNSVSITDDNLCFMLDYFAKFSTSLQELIIQNIKCVNSQKVSLKIKQFIEQTKITKLVLNNIGLKSKDFCLICLGVGTKGIFDYISIKDNEITEVAKKCLDVLKKFHKETMFDFSGNPIQKELKNKPEYQQCFVPFQQQ